MPIEITIIPPAGPRSFRTIGPKPTSNWGDKRVRKMVASDHLDLHSETRERIAETIEEHYALVDAWTRRATLDRRNERRLNRGIRLSRHRARLADGTLVTIAGGKRNDGRKPRAKTNRHRKPSTRELIYTYTEAIHLHHLERESAINRILRWKPSGKGPTNPVPTLLSFTFAYKKEEQSVIFAVGTAHLALSATASSAEIQIAI